MSKFNLKNTIGLKNRTQPHDDALVKLIKNIVIKKNNKNTFIIFFHSIELPEFNECIKFVVISKLRMCDERYLYVPFNY